MPLDRYKAKRDFSKTPEPAGDPTARGTGRFVVQRHRATRLHYDFRLEIDGVLPSWAIPKGPTLDPSIRRMAVHVEDHPIEYFDFEGVIPKGQYGAGDVIVWEWGTFEPEETDDPTKAIEDGELKFRLHGEKLCGRFTLVRTSRRPGSSAQRAFEDDEGEQWLLIKKRDECAKPGWDPEDHPKSVKTGRTNDEVKANRDALWTSGAPAAQAQIDLAGAVEARMPNYIEPMAATLAEPKPFDDPDWLYEIKWDGYRLEAVVRDAEVRLWTRRGNAGETYFGRLLSPPSWIGAKEAIVDGEIVAVDDDGVPSFPLLQERISALRAGQPEGGRGLVYQAFDLLYLDGRSLLKVPLEDRKRLLRSVLKDSGRVRFAAHVVEEGTAFFEAAKKLHVEGIIAKHRRSRYEPGKRSPAWLKIKIRPEQELVVGGWTPGEGNAKDLGALVVGVYEGGKLRYAGKVGSGFNARTRAELRKRLEALATDDCPYVPCPERKGELRTAHWVRPELVIRSELGGWTREGYVRQTAYKGLELDKDPKSVIRERPISPGDAERAAEAEVAEAEVAEARAAPEKTPAPTSVRNRRTKSQEPPGTTPAPTSVRNRRTKSQEPAGVTPAPTSVRNRRTKSQEPAGATPAPTSVRNRRTKSQEGTARGGTRRIRGGSGAEPGPRAQHDLSLVGSDGLPWVASRAELDALEGMGKEGTWRVGGEELKLTNLDKVIFPGKEKNDPPISKRELIRYFARIGPAMLPHLADRPLNLHRYPNGALAPGFWQKDIPSTAPQWLKIWHETGFREREDREANDHLLADRAATLCWLGNQTAFEVHAWTSTIHDPWKPAFALVDIDPGEKTTWEETLQIARLYRTAFEHLGVRAYPKLTGRRGIQAWIPIVRGKYSYEDTSRWVERVSRAIGQMVPDLVSWEWAKAKRQGKARLDYTQNEPIKTLVAPYSVRPAPGAPVSAPISWEELDDPSLRPNRWTIRDVVERVDKVGDLFAPAQTDQQELPAV